MTEGFRAGNAAVVRAIVSQVTSTRADCTITPNRLKICSVMAAPDRKICTYHHTGAVNIAIGYDLEMTYPFMPSARRWTIRGNNTGAHMAIVIIRRRFTRVVMLYVAKNTKTADSAVALY